MKRDESNAKVAKSYSDIKNKAKRSAIIERDQVSNGWDVFKCEVEMLIFSFRKRKKKKRKKKS